MPTARRIIPATDLPAWSNYAARQRDFELNPTKADGVLHRDELVDYIEQVSRERERAVRAGDSAYPFDMKLRQSLQLLTDMDDADVDGLCYLPEPVAALKLPANLRRRAVEILTFDAANPDRDGIDQAAVDRARRRYAELRGPMMAMLESERRAVQEIDELARRLNLF